MKAISVKYCPPTNTRGARFKASAVGVSPISTPYPYDEDDEKSALQLAQQLANRYGWGKLHPISGWTGTTWVFVFAKQ